MKQFAVIRSMTDAVVQSGNFLLECFILSNISKKMKNFILMHLIFLCQKRLKILI